jgi:nucleoside-diphosphate-sugar epimerase
MRVLVTGGTGYLGGAIVRALHRRGHLPLVFARRASTSGLSGTLLDGDIRNRARVLDAARQADAICHSAALVSVWSRPLQQFEEINVGGLKNVIDAARSAGVSRLVYTSSFLARPPAGRAAPLEANEYQRTKAAAWELARGAARTGAPIAVLMPGVIYGPGAVTEGNLVGRLVRDHLAGRLPGLLGADRTWSFAWIDDVAEAHVTAIERGTAGSEYALGGENAPQMRVFEILRDLTGHPLPRRLPFSIGTALAAIEEMRARVFDASPQLTRGTVEILRHDWPLDSSRSIAELGYHITPLTDGVRALLRALGAGSR